MKEWERGGGRVVWLCVSGTINVVVCWGIGGGDLCIIVVVMCER